MTLSTAERILLFITALTVAYRVVSDRWPVALEVSPSEGD